MEVLDGLSFNTGTVERRSSSAIPGLLEWRRELESKKETGASQTEKLIDAPQHPSFKLDVNVKIIRVSAAW